MFKIITQIQKLRGGRGTQGSFTVPNTFFPGGGIGCSSYLFLSIKYFLKDYMVWEDTM
jgi:hypothetical protein